ncbi:SusC/RagA family TonB-linked outer membrane protein [Mucilaginibacter psychrotolerans]|uniref:TonB-dependent receptor n=1 Tax=Mucilaginibacter psychrotolerans TaxID=1524096 RepID=A0A4Y8SGX2_9SPHI|nr:TonB-dependent receptor [Mucilaginibacter psychrotolerans]TFF38279.1 TonB-dependent receptor [Mucilaginibacter psychrotolerans]
MKRIYTISGLLLLFTFFSTFALAQNIIVKGKVTDAKTGEPLVGVSVGIQGTTTGTQTDVNGAFSVNAASNATLQVSYIGYTTQSVAVNGQTSIAILLQPSSTQLDQVVVVGYGTQRKLDVTGSVASVKGEEISKQASVNPVSALQGKVAGVQITNSGAPGASPEIKIRGTGTIYGNTNVLYVVDGVWYDDISFLAPSDIENISILKDASSTAIYGIRAANGVVLVSTKRGKTGTATVNYNGYAGWQTVTNQVKMANATEYATAINELAVSNGGAPLFTDVNSYGTGTNWYQQVLRDAFVTNHNVSINGGTEKSKYNFSIGMLDQDGNVKGNNYKRYTARLTNDYTPFSAIKLGYNVSGLYSKSNDIPNSIFRQLYAAGPVLPVYYADGSYGDPNDYNLGGGNNFNPQATLDFYNQRSQNYRFTGNAYAEVNFLKHFKIRTSFGGDIGQAEVRNYTPVYTATLAQRNNLSVLSVNRTETRNWIWENTLTYENTFAKDHRLTVLLGHTAQRYKSYNFNASAQNVPYSNGDADLYLSLGNTTGRNVTDGGSLNTALSYFARVNYAFKDRYLLNASIRQDGASQFYGNNVWGYFPSVGAGWVISKEPFMANQTVFDNLKLRASWGKVGNSGVPFNPTTLSVTQAAYLTAIFGGSPYTGASVNSVVPPTIFWERGVGTDIGLEAGVLNNRLTFELDYYNRKTQQAIFAIPILSSVGTGSGSIVGNQADFVNKGVEFSATWRGTVNSNFSYTIGGNVGYNKNKVLSTVTGANPIYAGGGGLANGALSTRTVLGSPIGEFYGYKVAGIFQTAAEVASSAQASSAKPGDFKYVDQNGDNIIDGKDRISLGDPNPKYTFGLNTSFNYKSFDLAIDAQGVAGVSIYNANIAYRFGNENFSKDFYDHRWTGANSTNTYPSVNVGSTTNSAPNSFYVESGAYVRIRNIQLGYTLPTALAKKAAMQKVRFFANAQNPISFFKYRGFSPEIGGAPTNAGIDNSVYPLYATYNFGVNVTF